MGGEVGVRVEVKTPQLLGGPVGRAAVTFPVSLVGGGEVY